MEKARKRVREQRLQKYSRILSDKYNIGLKLRKFKGYGYCDTAQHVVINETIDGDAFTNLVLQKAITLHEIGHILYTSSTAWKDVDPGLRNLISDGRDEEAMSRLYQKARLYFIYANQMILQYKPYEFEPVKGINLEKGIMDLIFREAKKTTGIPQLPKSMHAKLKKELGIDYDWLLAKTRDAIEAKTEKGAAAITKDIELRVKKIMGRDEYSQLKEVNRRASLSIEKCGSSSRQMPKEDEEEKEEVEAIIKVLEKAADDTKDDEPGDSGKMLDIDVSETVSSKDNEQTEDGPKDEDINVNTEITNDDVSIDTSKNGKKENDKAKDNEAGNELEKLMESINDQIEDEIIGELNNEITQLNKNDIEGDFGDYGIDDDEMVIRTKYGSKRKPVDSKKLENIANRISHSFKIIAERGDGWVHNKTRGKLEMHKITRVIANDPRVFKNIDKKELNDISAVILLDASGSMSGNRCKLATEAAYIVTRALELGKYNSEVLQFGCGHKRNMNGLKAFNQKLDYAKHKFIPTSHGTTPLLRALEGAEKSLLCQNSKRRVVIVATDGYPDRREECKAKINELEKKGIAVIGILIYRRDIYNIFHEDRRILCKDVNELPVQMSGVIKNVLMTIKR